MKLKALIKELQAFEKDLSKEKKDWEIIFSSDEEGNSYCDDAEFGIDTIGGKEVVVLFPMGENFTA